MDCNRNVESHDKQLFIFLNCVIDFFDYIEKPLSFEDGQHFKGQDFT